MNICTIIAKNYVAHARVLAESFKEAHPEGNCAVLVIDDFDGYLDPAEEPFELIELDAIGLPDPEAMAAGYDVTELSTAVKPWLLRTLLARDGVEAITYLDPDIWVAGSIAEVDRLAREHDVVLTPHFTSPLPRDGLKPAEEDILIAGAYNLGFISLGAGETADELLDWWSERLERHCVIEPGEGRFVDQRWIDLVPGIWPKTHILRDTTFNIAYWNLPTRSFERGDEGFTVDGRELRFFHFSGFDPLRPKDLSKHQNRIEVADSEALTEVCEFYAGRLLDRGHREARTWAYGWEVLPNGVRLDAAARRLYRDAPGDTIKGSVFNRRGAKRFLSYLNETPGRNGGVSRYALAVRDSRTDLREAFADVEGRDAAAFKRWMHDNADPMRISGHLLPPLSPERGNGARPEAPEAPAAPSEPAAPPKIRGRLGVNLAGYLGSELGVGEAARQVRSALEARDLKTTEIEVPVDAAAMPAALGDLEESDLPYDFNLICVNADMLPALANSVPQRFFEGRHSAGLWFWEVEEFPERWRGSFDHLDEVWVASEFVAQALRPISPVPVTTIRVPVAPLEPAEAGRKQLGMPDGFCFLFVFDYRSVFRRKNPLGAIEAFTRAFEPGEGPSLVIKSIYGDAHPEEAAALSEAAAGRPDVHLVDAVVSAAEKNAMIASSDCYVSLHRSEGLGLTMAEAMYFGKPVIATAYSGNLDFMTEENGYLVGHSLSRIGGDAGPYPEGARWAEPDLDQAAARMREVFDDREGAARKGSQAAEDIRSGHSPEAAGRVLEARLTEIRRQRVIARFDSPSRAADAPADPAVPEAEVVPAAVVEIVADPASGRAQLHHLLRFEEAPPRRGAGRFRRFAKRLYLRVLRPYSSYQHRVDISARDALDELSGELAALERRSDEATEEEIGRLEGEFADLEKRAVTATEESIGQLEQELADLGRATEEGNRAAAKQLEGALRGLRERHDAELRLLKGQVDAATAGLRKEAAKRSQAREALEGSLDEVRGTIEALMSSIEDVQQEATERVATAERSSAKGLEDAQRALTEAIQAAHGEAAGAIQAVEADTAEALRLGREIEARDGELRTSLEAQAAQLQQAIRLAEAGGERMTAAQADAAEHRAGVRRSVEAVEATLERDRSFVDAIRSAQDRLTAKTEGAISELQAQIGDAAAAHRAAAAKPYMADDRFPAHDDPRLGNVIGFGGEGAKDEAGRGYRGFEDLFRGPERLIRERQRVYVDLVADAAPVLDAGCGRGEFLELLRDAEIEAEGIDLDPGMVARCREKKLENVEVADLIEFLESTPEGSLGCVFSAQVIEHLDTEDLRRFLDLSLTRLRPGGLLIAETVNPHSAQALKAFWVDPTHRRPLFPETMLAMCQLAGFDSGDAFCPVGTGNWEVDRLVEGEYAIVVSAPA